MIIKISIYSILLIFFINCTSKTDGRNFHEFAFDNVLIDESFVSYGTNFYIHGIQFYDTVPAFVYPIRNEKIREKLSSSNYLRFREFDLYWRRVEPPFRITKKRFGDTLIVRKDNVDYIFTKQISNK